MDYGSERQASQLDDINLVDVLNDRQQQEHNHRTRVGLGMIAAGVGLGVASFMFAHSDTKLTHELPFNQPVQTAVNNIDTLLTDIGELSLPLALGTIGGVKLVARKNPSVRRADKWSSQELADEGHRVSSWPRRALSATVAGSIPVIACGAVGLTSLFNAVGTEVTTGPNRPIEALSQFVPGNSMVVQYKNAMPMVESDVPQTLAQNIESEANAQNVTATPIGMSLGTITVKSQNLTALTLGVPAAVTAPKLSWSPDSSCNAVPVYIDKAANVPEGTTIGINGVNARVVGETNNFSALNRIGVVMSNEALSTCIEQDKSAPYYAVILNSSQKKAEQILTAADKSLEDPAVVITKEQYISNSESFWRKNVKPITNVFELVAGAMALSAVAGAMRSRIIRNRRELATNAAGGESNAHMKLTELLRSLKDGVAASLIGNVGAAIFTPVVNIMESGFRVGVDLKSAAAGCAIGVVGSLLGGLTQVAKINKTVDPSEHTRV